MNEVSHEPTEAELLAVAEQNRLQKADRMRQEPAWRTEQIQRDTKDIEARMASLGAKIAATPIKANSDVPDPRIAQAQKLLDAAGIPLRHRRRIPPAPTPWNAEFEKIIAHLGNGFLIPVTGVQGTGKTQLASALIYAATDKLMTARYLLAMDFFIALKETFGDGAKRSESSIIAEFAKPKLLVLDEMDERSESPWENRLLFHLINLRYNNLVDTLLISRAEESTFLTSLGTSIQSRIQETGASIVCTWGSFREGNQ